MGFICSAQEVRAIKTAVGYKEALRISQMMLGDFFALDGTKKLFDLDNVYEIVRGFSEKRQGWTSLVVYEPTYDTFVELRSSPPDIRGDSMDEAEEVLPIYIEKSYGLSKSEIDIAQSKPTEWVLVNLRGS